jgi:hypothetical protein
MLITILNENKFPLLTPKKKRASFKKWARQKLCDYIAEARLLFFTRALKTVLINWPLVRSMF